MFRKKEKNTNKNNAGFGLIELLVSISILVLVMSIIMFKHSSFNSAVLLRGQAYKLALHAREVQLNAVSVLGEGGDFRQIYGLYFDTSTPKSTYTVFKDKVTYNYFYNAGEEDFSERGILDARFAIDEISFVGSSFSSDKVSVVFERPNFDARFFSGEDTEVDASAVEIRIRLKGSSGTSIGEIKTVEITKTGQISVK